MDTSLTTLTIRTPLDLVRARQRARQVGGLLGLQGLECTALATAVFAVTEHHFREGGTFVLSFRCRGRQLVVSCRRGMEAGVSLVRNLADEPRVLSDEDAAWAASQLESLTPVDLLDEIRQLNQDVLAALQGTALSEAAPRILEAAAVAA